LLLVTIAVGVIFSLLRPFPQPQSYHSFADHRSLFGIPNFGDVASNLPFAMVGAWGLVFLASAATSASFINQHERWPYIVAFAGLTLTFFGSSYYHLHPDNARLVWDRLPMTLVFMSIVSVIIVERISLRAGLWLLPLLLLIGISSVVQWHASELRGAGDLRFYAAVQAYSAVVLLIALLFPSRYSRGSDFAVVVGFYALAKTLELLDKAIFGLGHFVSGHTLKHLAAAGAGYWILRMLQKRQAEMKRSNYDREKMMVQWWDRRPTMPALLTTPPIPSSDPANRFSSRRVPASDAAFLRG
jgi:hypothetical protein